MDEEKLKALGITLEAWQAMSDEEKAEQLRQLQSQEDQQNSTSPTQQEQYNGTPTQKGTEQDLDLVNENSKPDDGGITKNSLSIAQQRMRGLVNRPSYSDFEKMLGSYVNKDGNLSWKDRRNFRKALREKGINMSRSLMRRIGKSFNRDETNGAFNNYVNSLERKYYIKDGKLYTQGQDGYQSNDYDIAEDLGKAGTDVTALVNKYNQDVINARKNAKIVYDPVTNTYKASGKVGDTKFTDLDVTNADWFKNDIDRQRAAQLTAYRSKVDALDSDGLAKTYGTKWGPSGLAEILEINPKDLEAYNKKDAQGNYVMSTDDRAKFRRKQTSALKQKLDALRLNSEGGFDFEGNVKADQITKYLIDQQKKDLNAYSFLDNVSFAPGEQYALAGRAANVGGSWSHLRKNGGTLKQRTQAYKKGGAGYTVGQIGRSKWGSERDAWEEYKQQVGLTDEQPIEYITPNVIPGSVYSSPQATTETYTPDLTYTPYFSNQILIGGYKNGGTLNMNKINYFQEGGAMAPQAAQTAAPAQAGQDIQAQVMQLVQAAMNGDEQATQAIQQIMQAAQQGDQQAAQIAQMIQDVAKQMQGQATAAKYGAKLSYIKSLRSGCPEGYEVSYHKKGGVLCKECVAKSHVTPNQTINNATRSTVTSTYNYAVNRVNNTISGIQKQQTQDETSSSDITSLYKKGGCLKKKLSCGKKMQEGSKVDEAKCGTKMKAACGTKATMDKCGGKTKKKKCSDGSKVIEDKCGGKAKKKKCLNGGILTIEALQTAYKSLNA